MEDDVMNDDDEEEYSIHHKSLSIYGNLETEVSLDPLLIVRLQLLSNWGHPQRIGLTEVQFFDVNKQPLTVATLYYGDCICIKNEKGSLNNLINGKTKTIKEKLMWSCDFTDNKPKELVFCVKVLETRWQQTVEDIYTEPSRWLGIWNFNKSLKDLEIGVKDIRVLVDGTVAYEGRIEKGCGNQVFEYGQFIALDASGTVDTPVLIYSKNIIASGESYQEWCVTALDSREGADSGKQFELCTWETMNDRYVPTSEELIGVSPTVDEEEEDDTVVDYLADRDRDSDEQTLWQDRESSAQRPRPTWFSNFRKNSSADTLPLWLRNYECETSRNEKLDSPSSTNRYRQLHGRQTSYQNSSGSASSRLSSGCISCASSSQSDLLEDLFCSDDAVLQKRESSARFGRRAVSAYNIRSEDFLRSASRNSEGSVIREDCLTTLDTVLPFNQIQCNDRLGRDSLDSYVEKENKAKRKPNRNSVGQTGKSVCANSDVDFIIPELPEGHRLTVNIKTTWGDPHYVGLNGIEMFDSSGEPVCIENIWANPADINVLPEYSKDPRVVTNLINGVYRTKDDTNVWLAPFTPGENHIICLTFKEKIKLALVRIWNYNKSRIHSFRGAKDVEITLDDQCIFKGEIVKACGAVIGGPEAFGDTILFTLDDEILERIAANDKNFLEGSEGDVGGVDRCTNNFVERPPTSTYESELRPYTAANVPDFEKVSRAEFLDDDEDSTAFQCNKVELILCSNWGDAKYIGLTAIELIGMGDDILKVENGNVVLKPSAHHTCTVFRLFNGVNVTTDRTQMWLTQLQKESHATISITFEDMKLLTGLRMWNYNVSLEDSYCGVKLLAVKIDGHLVSPPEGYLVRRAPGNCHFDFAQQISFVTSSAFETDMLYESLDVSTASSRKSSSHEYETLVMPRGFVFQVQLLSTWGDQYYVGLNGIELYDPMGNKILLSEGDVAAYPDSVNVLDGISDDVRTPDKLVDGVNDTKDGHHMWLAPILPGVINRVYVIFDYPVTVSMIKLWNYAKTPSRGVKEFAIVVDDLLIYHGVLEQMHSDTSYPLPYRTVVFTTDRHIFQSERHTLIRNDGIGQDVQMTNNSHVVHKSKSSNSVDQALRPFTSLPPRNSSRSGFRQH